MHLLPSTISTIPVQVPQLAAPTIKRLVKAILSNFSDWQDGLPLGAAVRPKLDHGVPGCNVRIRLLYFQDINLIRFNIDNHRHSYGWVYVRLNDPDFMKIVALIIDYALDRAKSGTRVKKIYQDRLMLDDCGIAKL